MSSKRLSSGSHGQTLAYYEANAGRFIEDTHEVDMSPLNVPFLSLLPPGDAYSTPVADRDGTAAPSWNGGTR